MLPKQAFTHKLLTLNHNSSFWVQLAKSVLKINMIHEGEDVIMRAKSSCSVLRSHVKRTALGHWALAPVSNSNTHKGTSVRNYSVEFYTQFLKHFFLEF